MLHIIAILIPGLFNMLNKWVARCMIQQAERYSLLLCKAYGSRKGHRHIDCNLNNTLENNLIQQLHLHHGALCAGNGTKLCFNKIIQDIALLTMQYIGVTEKTYSVIA